MKATASLFLLLASLFLLPFQSFAQDRLNVEGLANTASLVNFTATDMNSGYDIIEIEAPNAPTSTVGQFIECQLASGAIRMRVNYDGTAFFSSEVNINSDIFLDESGTNSSSEIRMEDNSNNETILLRSKDGASDIGGEILLRGGAGTPTTIEIDGNFGGTGLGRIRTDELEIEGADIAEQFDVAAAPHTEGLPQAGMLVSIHPNQPGKLQVSANAYDAKVAGVISGANGVRTGMYLGQPGTIADGDFPVAVAGRVYVFADASFGAIEPGDMLTSSPTPGHAMKVKNHHKARGAVVGKAMSELKSGQGYVLMLVNLQ